MIPSSGTRRAFGVLAAIAAVTSCAHAGTVSPAATSGSTSSTTSTTSATTTGTLAPVATSIVAGTDLTGRGSFLGPVKTVPVGSITLSYRQFGSGPSLVLLQGEGSAMSTWPLTFLAALASHWSVTIVDYRSIGLSTDTPGSVLTLELLADDTAALIDALRLGTPDVVGLSTGGEVGLLLAAQHPGSIRRLVASGATVGGASTVQADAKVNALFEDPTVNPAELFPYLFPPGASAALTAFITDLVAVPQTDVPADVATRFHEAERLYNNDATVPELWPKLRLPVLVYDGALDELVPTANARELARLIPGARLELVPGASHLAMLQDASAFTSLLIDFLR